MILFDYIRLFYFELVYMSMLFEQQLMTKMVENKKHNRNETCLFS